MRHSTDVAPVRTGNGHTLFDGLDREKDVEKSWKLAVSGNGWG